MRNVDKNNDNTRSSLTFVPKANRVVKHDNNPVVIVISGYHDTRGDKATMTETIKSFI